MLKGKGISTFTIPDPKKNRPLSLVGSVQYMCPVELLCIVDARLCPIMSGSDLFIYLFFFFNYQVREFQVSIDS